VIGRRVVGRGLVALLVFRVVGGLLRHPYWLIWSAALVVLAMERGW
jgi:hypothetical protein